MLSRLLYRREAEKLLLLMRAIKRGREEEEGGVIIALICGAMWSLLSPGWITKLCMFASLQSLMWSRSREGCCRAGTKGKLCWSSLRLWPSGFPNTSVLLSSGCSKKQKKKQINGFHSSFNFYSTREDPLRTQTRSAAASEDVQKVCFSHSEPDKRLLKMIKLSVTLSVYMSWSWAGGKYQAHVFKSPQNDSKTALVLL